MDSDICLDELIQKNKKKTTKLSQYDQNRGVKRYSRSRSNNSRSNSSKEQIKNQIGDKSFLNIDSPFCLVLRDENDDVQKEFTYDLRINQVYHQNDQEIILKETDCPYPNIKLGSPFELNLTKKQIDPIQKQWDSIKFQLNDIELIDIYRPPKIAKARYSLPVVNYDFKNNGKTNGNGLRYVFSRAYFKLWEVLSEYKVMEKYKDKSITIACVAEGPGGFIHCLLDFRQAQHNSIKWNHDKYRGITLKSSDSTDWGYKWAQNFFQKIKDDGYDIIRSYGTGNGNMLDLKNLDFFVQNDLQNEKVDLVTGDGGIEVSGDEYDYQELCNAKLFFAEMVYAFSTLKNGGVFILKIYEAYYDVTIQILLLICQHFQKVILSKPHTSRPASAERYLVCQNFLGIHQTKLDELKKLLVNWVEKEPIINHYLENDKKVKNLVLIQGNEIFFQKFYYNLFESNKKCNQQIIDKINRGLEMLKNPENKQRKNNYKRLEEQRIFALDWCKKYNVPYVQQYYD